MDTLEPLPEKKQSKSLPPGTSTRNFPVFPKPRLSVSKKTQETLAVFNSAFMGGLGSGLAFSSLKNSPKTHTFSKAERFPSLIKKCATDFLDPINSNKQASRYCTMGFGKRGQYLENSNILNPGPSQYNVESQFDPKSKLKGKSFGASRKSYENVCVPGLCQMAPKEAAELPGPGQYRSVDGIKPFRKITLKGRIPFIDTERIEKPAPNYYDIRYNQVEQGRYKGTSFGVGSRPANIVGKGVKLAPGPGTYILPSPFDKFERISKQGKVYKLQPIMKLSGNA